MRLWRRRDDALKTVAGLFFMAVFLVSCTAGSGPKLSDSPDNYAARYALAEEELRQDAADTFPRRQSGRAHFRQGLLLQSEGRHRQAIEEFNHLLALEPAHVRAYNAIGVSYDKLGEYDIAVRYYQAALSLDAELDYVYNNLGYSWYLQGNYTAAVKAFLKAVELNPERQIYQNNLGMAYARKGAFDEVLMQFESEGSGAPASAAVLPARAPAAAPSAMETASIPPPERLSVIDLTDSDTTQPEAAAPAPKLTAAAVAPPAPAEIEITSARDYPPGFTVQLGVFDDKHTAAHLVHNLQQRGHHPYIVERSMDASKACYLVRIGHFSTAAQALPTANHFFQKEQLPNFVTSANAAFCPD